MPDESTMAPCSVWAQVRVTSIPIDPSRKMEMIEAGVKVCSIPDPDDGIAAWSVELHTEGAAPASVGARRDVGPDQAQASPKEAFYAETVFNSAAVLTHIKSRCDTLKDEHFTKAIKLTDVLVFMPGDRARVEVNVYRDSAAAKVPQPSLEVFQEPELGRTPTPSLGSPRPGLGSPRRPGGIPTRPLGLFY